MKIETMWIVQDPDPLSEFADICHETSPAGLVKIAAATFAAGGWPDAKHMWTSLAIYTEEAEARADAEQRIAARDASLAASTSTGTIRVWELFGGHVRLFESGEVQHWDAHGGSWVQGWGAVARWHTHGEDSRRIIEWEQAVKAYRMRPPWSAT